MISRRTVFCLGLSQLICWGITYHLIGALGERIAADLGWSRSLIYGGFSAALLVMGLASPLVGRSIDRHGGRVVMVGRLGPDRARLPGSGLRARALGLLCWETTNAP